MIPLAKFSGLRSAASRPLLVADLFKAQTYTGNGASRSINNGLNLSGVGGATLLKQRSSGGNSYFNGAGMPGSLCVYDTVRGAAAGALATNSTDPATTIDGLTAFNSNGFSLGVSIYNESNVNAETYMSWSLCKAARFFDVVTYTGNGANRTVAHGLGVVPGMILVKRRDSAGNWMAQHRSLTDATKYMVPNAGTAEAAGATAWNSTFADASVFSLGTHTDTNANGVNYVAYLFAHDTAADSIIQCGTFTADGSGNATVSGLPFQPQFVLFVNSQAGSGWILLDTARGWASGADNYLSANANSAEAAYDLGAPTSDGFTIQGVNSSQKHIYMAIKA